MKHAGREIHRLHNLLLRDQNQSPLREQINQMTANHGYILCWLREHQGEDVFQRDLEKQLQLRRSSVTAVLQTMERSGLIERVAVPGDARLKKLVPTPRAEELHQLISQDIADREARLTAGISSAELEAFWQVMDKLGRNLEQGLYPSPECACAEQEGSTV